MKKTGIIIGSVALFIALLGGAWWYLLMNGRPDGLADIPNPFGNSSEEVFAPTEPTDTDGTPAPTGALRRISTTPVAGAVLIERDSATYARFVERGTGHIFEVSLTDGATTRLSGTTIPRVTSAVWSPQGSRVVLATETGASAVRLFVGTLDRTDGGEGTLTTVELESGARNIAFSSTGDSVLYTVPTAAGSAGYENNLKTDVRATVFTSPLRDLVVEWGSGTSTSSPQTVYTAPTAHLPGYAYTGAGFARLFGGQRGLMLFVTDEHRVVTTAENGSLSSHLDTPDGVALPVPVFPEKCARGSLDTTIWCAAPLGLAPGAYPDLWYQGAVSFDDSIWKIDAQTGETTLVSTPSQAAGQAIDATDMRISPAGDTLLFINKKDGMLWVQEVAQ